MKESKKIKKYFVEYLSLTSGIRIKEILYSNDYILYTGGVTKRLIKAVNWDNFNTEGININSLVIKVKAENTSKAHIESLNKLYKITAYLAGIFQAPFFITDPWNFLVYRRFYVDISKRWSDSNILYKGRNTLYSIGLRKKSCSLVEDLPKFDNYKKYEDVFYLWRSAEDLFNELGWRFLNYIRIIELITKKQRGGKQKAKKMYTSLPDDCKSIIDKNNFVRIIQKWGNPTAHGNIPNAVIPRIHHGQFNQDKDAINLSGLIKILIKEYIN